MNVAFHELVGIAIAHEASAALGPPTAYDGGSTTQRRGTIWAAAFGLAVLSHGILDGLPHYYPLGIWPDTVVSIAFLAFWLTRVPRWMRVPVIVVCVGSLLPDIIDHVPRDLNRHLHLGLPEWPKLFPWHWREGSGSIPGKTGPLWRVSVANHAIVVAFCVTAFIRTRQLLRRS